MFMWMAILIFSLGTFIGGYTKGHIDGARGTQVESLQRELAVTRATLDMQRARASMADGAVDDANRRVETSERYATSLQEQVDKYARHLSKRPGCDLGVTDVRGMRFNLRGNARKRKSAAPSGSD